MALEWVTGADFRCFLHHCCEPGPFGWVLVPSLATKRPKIDENESYIYIYIYIYKKIHIYIRKKVTMWH